MLLVAVAPASAAAQARDTLAKPINHYWPKLALGAVSSILAHEAGHLVTSLAVGGHPTFGFDTFRPTIYSGISSRVSPHKQFLVSVSGLTVQTVIDEAILDIPHHRGSAFERGVLAGGIGTTVFYLTIGRRGSVSDIDFIARTHGMSKAQSTLLFGSIATLQTIRIWRNPSYANFFVRPRGDGGAEVGVSLKAP
jgi:hypothetical protein